MAVDKAYKKLTDDFVKKAELFCKEHNIEMTTLFHYAGFKNYNKVKQFEQGNGGIGIKTMIKVESYIKSFKKD